MDSGPDKSKINSFARRFTELKRCPTNIFLKLLTVLGVVVLFGDKVAAPTPTILGALTTTDFIFRFFNLIFNSLTMVWTSGNSGIKEISKNCFAFIFGVF